MGRGRCPEPRLRRDREDPPSTLARSFAVRAPSHRAGILARETLNWSVRLIDQRSPSAIRAQKITLFLLSVKPSLRELKGRQLKL